MERRELLNYILTGISGFLTGVLTYDLYPTAVKIYNDRTTEEPEFRENKTAKDTIKPIEDNENDLSNQDDASNYGFLGYFSRDTIDKLQSGGYVLYVRHEETQSGLDQQKNVKNVSDPTKIPEWEFEECRLQRNLNIEGWRRAKKTSEAFSILGISFNNAFSSPWCRCRKHAELAVGDYEIVNGLDYTRDNNYDKIIELVNSTSNDSNTIVFAHGLESVGMKDFIEESSADKLGEGQALVIDPSEDSEGLEVIDGPGFN